MAYYMIGQVTIREKRKVEGLGPPVAEINDSIPNIK
jgi:hypothetical protein